MKVTKANGLNASHLIIPLRLEAGAAVEDGLDPRTERSSNGCLLSSGAGDSLRIVAALEPARL